MNFSSDNASGAAPQIMAALERAQDGHAPGYGSDDWTTRAEQLLCEIFERKVQVFLVSTGTAANAIALGLYASPGALVACHSDAHIQVDECGAPSLLAPGLRLMTVDGLVGKIAPDVLDEQLFVQQGSGVHGGRVTALSLTNLNEYGKAYTIAEVEALTEVARRHNLYVHMDGARFANLVAALNVAPADVTWRAGVDVLTFGGTKNGCWAVEAIVVFADDEQTDLPFLRKRAGHLLSKGRFLGAQMEAYLTDGLWLNLAANANAMAQRLAAGLKASPHATLLTEPDGNEVFAVLSDQTDHRLRAAGAAYYPWEGTAFSEDVLPGENAGIYRFVAGFSTSELEVDQLLAKLNAV